jgi:F0F1-type ATP synthase assembly protein I
LISRPALVAANRNGDRVSRVHDPYAKGRLLARRMAQLQLLTGAALAALVWVVTRAPEMAVGVAWGAASLALAQAVFARRQLQGVAAVATMLKRFYGAAAWKWLVFFALFALGLVVLRLPAGGLLTGLIAAQIAGTGALIRYG